MCLGPSVGSLLGVSLVKSKTRPSCFKVKEINKKENIFTFILFSYKKFYKRTLNTFMGVQFGLRQRRNVIKGPNLVGHRKFRRYIRLVIIFTHQSYINRHYKLNEVDITTSAP